MPKIPNPIHHDEESQQLEQTANLILEVARRAPPDAAMLLARQSDTIVIHVLQTVKPALAIKILQLFQADRKEKLLPLISSSTISQWDKNPRYQEGTIGQLMDPIVGILHSQMTVQEAVEKIRDDVKTSFITYGYIIDNHEKLLGVVVMRDLLLASPHQRLDDLMVPHPYFLKPEMRLQEAIHEALHRHYPTYPVCDESGRLIGLIRGFDLFAEHTVQITAQPGKMVGVQEEERLDTRWQESLKFRHPWLQLNLFTSFIAAFVVGIFEDTINQVVALAIFLPVMAGQSGNTGCQALAITLRGLTLGELRETHVKTLVVKEAWLGLLNGILVGVVAGLAMGIFAKTQNHALFWQLGLIVFLAMVFSCVISGVSGAMVPLSLKKLGADPATASSIFLTTATDVASMGFFLGLASIFII